MSSTQGDDFQEIQPESASDQPELELEAGPRAERPNFLTATRFVDFDLPPEILEGIDNAGFEYCTPIQAQAIPVAMSGLDIAGQAQTGTGKTTAFLVPLLTRLLNNKPAVPNLPRAIIVTPTRELALQIHEDALVLAGNTPLRQVLVIGGMEYKEQADLLATGPEIIICTPGRIIDYLQQGVFKTQAIEVAVVDEADRLLDMGFIKDLKYLLGKLPPYTQRQTMLFSATLDERVLELTYQFMNPPQFITAEPDKTTKVNIEQELYHVGREEKLSLLIGLLRREPHQRVIIFSNTKSGVEWLAKKLTMNGFQAEGITGDLPQPKRLKLMEAFKENRLQILVATDVASRGIHVDDVSHVYNYDLPQDAENYVHRIGRTARAGNTGKAVSFGCEDYVFHLEAIENLLGEKIPVCWADQELFMEDHGGEVRLKDRRGGDRGKRNERGSDRRGGRESGGDRRPVSRGPAKSQRPGGIFGLSPRLQDNAAEDARQALSWSVGWDQADEAVEELEAAPAAGQSPASSESSERADGRRRKRRRGRRGRDGAAPAAGIAAAETGLVTEVAAGDDEGPAQAVEAGPGDVVAAAVPETGKPANKYPSRGRSRRSSGEKAVPTAPVTAEAAPVVPAASVEVDAPAEAPVKKTRKPAAKPKAEPPVAKEEVPAKKPGRVAKKAVEEPAVKTDEAKAAPVKKPRVVKAKKAEEAAPSADAAKKPAAKAPAKKAEPKKAAPVATKKAAGAVKKAVSEDPKETAPKKTAAKKPPAKKAEAAGEVAPKAKTPRASTKKVAEAGEAKAPVKKPAKKTESKTATTTKKATPAKRSVKKDGSAE